MIKSTITHKGSCHCKRIQFTAIGSNNIEVLNCSCSICSMTSYKHYVVPKVNFTLLKGKNFLSTYKFNTKIAKHYFCKKCGIKAFYIPRSHPNHVSLNLNCINSNTINNIKIINFDGKNWEKNVRKII